MNEAIGSDSMLPIKFPPMRCALVLALALTAAPAMSHAAQDKPAGTTPKQEDPPKPVTERDVSAGDVVTTPVTDLNLKKDEIPPLLTMAEMRPYDLTGLTSCSRLSAAVSDLDRLLGDDVDVAPARQGQTSVGRVAQSAVGSLIPFRGLIREISGANAQERKLQAAVFAGGARRAFLKGVGQQRGCRYPARAATPAVLAARDAAAAQAIRQRDAAKAAPAKRD